jgi:hypothetical protein
MSILALNKLSFLSARLSAELFYYSLSTTPPGDYIVIQLINHAVLQLEKTR